VDKDLPHGVAVSDLIAHPDDRGALTELFRQSWLPPGISMVQANLSTSRAGVLRGMHFHRHQVDYWIVLEGVAFVGLFDLRAGSPSERATATITLDAAAGLHALYIPPGVAHGFCAVTEMQLQYLVSCEFTGADEHGFSWNDPALGIRWPVADPIVSERDSTSGSLADALADQPTFSGT
jgi:dTDP-4-dehydrorhamnose 3,5-epimerase